MGVKWVALTGLEVSHTDEETKVITVESELEAGYVGLVKISKNWDYGGHGVQTKVNS